MTTSFVERLIDITFERASGTFTGTKSNKLKLSGLRASVRISKAGGPSMGVASIVIFGMTLSQMNDLSTLGQRIQFVGRNTVTVEAGDVEAGMTVVFIGTITNAWANFAASPETSFNVEAHTLGAQAVQSIKPSSFPGTADVATIMRSLATQMGVSFENNGVTTKLSNQYLSGSARDQALKVVEAAGISWNGGDNGVLAIWPKNGTRGGQIPLVSAKTGLVSYPSYIKEGIILTTVFNPSISFGASIMVQSIVLKQPANGKWYVFALDMALDSLIPDGQWFQTLSCVNYQGSMPPPVLR